MKDQFAIRPSEIDTNLKDEREGRLIHIGVVISTLILVASVATILITTFNRN